MWCYATSYLCSSAVYISDVQLLKFGSLDKVKVITESHANSIRRTVSDKIIGMSEVLQHSTTARVVNFLFSS